MVASRRQTADERLAQTQAEFAKVLAANGNNYQLAVKAVSDSNEKILESERRGMAYKTAAIAAIVGVASFITGGYLGRTSVPSSATPQTNTVTNNTTERVYQLSEADAKELEGLRGNVNAREEEIKQLTAQLAGINNEKEKDKEGYTTKIKQLEEDKIHTQTEYALVLGQKAQVEAKANSLEAQVLGLTDTLGKANAENVTYEAQIKEVQGTKATLETQLNESKDLYAKLETEYTTFKASEEALKMLGPDYTEIVGALLQHSENRNRIKQTAQTEGNKLNTSMFTAADNYINSAKAVRQYMESYLKTMQEVTKTMGTLNEQLRSLRQSGYSANAGYVLPTDTKTETTSAEVIIK